MSLLLQLNGDLPDRFPNDERRLYVFSCRTRQCRRKAGSIVTIRGVKNHLPAKRQQGVESENPASQDTARLNEGLGTQLFGATAVTKATGIIPFSQPKDQPPTANSFAEPSPKSPQRATEQPLAESFASKLRVRSIGDSGESKSSSEEPWPPESSFPKPLPYFYLDSEYETLIPETNSVPEATSSTIQYEDEGPINGKGLDKDVFESSIDKTFLKFSDRLAQNPEQVLRYEFQGAPLLYSGTDDVGKKLASSSAMSKGSLGMPRCESCGSDRVFEMQLVPGAINVLEEIELDIEDGMDWGTIIVGVCGKNCGELGNTTFRLEWCGVQWEERG